MQTVVITAYVGQEYYDRAVLRKLSLPRVPVKDEIIEVSDGTHCYDMRVTEVRFCEAETPGEYFAVLACEFGDESLFLEADYQESFIPKNQWHHRDEVLKKHSVSCQWVYAHG